MVNFSAAFGRFHVTNRESTPSKTPETELKGHENRKSNRSLPRSAEICRETAKNAPRTCRMNSKHRSYPRHGIYEGMESGNRRWKRKRSEQKPGKPARCKTEGAAGLPPPLDSPRETKGLRPWTHY